MLFRTTVIVLNVHSRIPHLLLADIFYYVTLNMVLIRHFKTLLFDNFTCPPD